jgi:hypothetical protein
MEENEREKGFSILCDNCFIETGTYRRAAQLEKLWNARVGDKVTDNDDTTTSYSDMCCITNIKNDKQLYTIRRRLECGNYKKDWEQEEVRLLLNEDVKYLLNTIDILIRIAEGNNADNN